MCDRLGLDVWEVIEAAATKPYGFMKFLPGPGLGGHCIPVDPTYLAWKMKSLNFPARFIDLATEINGNMPEHVVSRIADLLNDDRLAVNGSRVLVLGVAYKADVADVRESPALDVIRLLAARGADVRYHDPHVSELEVVAAVALEPLLDALAGTYGPSASGPSESPRYAVVTSRDGRFIALLARLLPLGLMQAFTQRQSRRWRNQD